MRLILLLCIACLMTTGDATAQDPVRLPSITLPPELERVLRDYERAWAAGDGEALAALFTPDGFVRAEAGWIRGTAAITARYANAGGDLRLRALAYAESDAVGYIVGAYGYGDDAAVSDRGSFLLALRRSPDGRWLIAADLDNSI
jgi:ketosteroid isomerase-like protein